MAVSVKDIQNSLGDRFQLRLVAGAAGLDAIVTWIHMLEDSNVVDFFWGNEMIVTSGLLTHEEKDLLKLFDVLNSKRCSAVVLNTGKYIQTIPKSLIEFCEENVIPLYTMPWHMSMTEFVRASCTALTRDIQSDEDLARAVINAVNAPQEPGGYYSRLSSYFNETGGFQMIAVRVHSKEFEEDENLITNQHILDQRTLLRLHTALRGIEAPYLIFRNDSKRILLLINSTDPDLALSAGRKILDRIKDRLPDVRVHVGIGEICHHFKQLADAYHSAISAQRCASLQGQELIEFADMGFYRLLYSVPHDELLYSYYTDTVGVLADYDAAHGGNLRETLFRYLLSSCSMTETAAQMFTHRNTINYRMGKIREITGCSFETSAERMPYLLAYYIGTILKIRFDGEHYKI